MARLLKFLIYILMMILSIGGRSIMSEKPDFLKNESEKQAEMAEQMLYEKYGEVFVVESLGGRWGAVTDYFYTCNVHPANNEELSFQATVSKDYTILHDEYARILGFKEKTSELLKIIKKSSNLNIISKLSLGIKKLSITGRNMLELDINSSHLYNKIVFWKYHTELPNEYKQGVIIK